MHNKKENLLDKFVKRDYKNKLETVLEGKLFDEDAKSLLLEILYKIETAYKDYSKVKKDIEVKEEYLEHFINVIKNDCEIIKIIKPSEQSELLKDRTFKINKSTKEIMCLPIARKLLYSVSKISNKERIIVDKYFLIDRTLSNTLNIGYNINTVEPLRDFDGWSWTTIAREIDNIEYNLIYQNLQILLGTNFLNRWIRTEDGLTDYMKSMENNLEDICGKRLKNRFVKSLNRVSVLMELKVNDKIEQEIIQSEKEITEELEKIENKKEYVTNLTEQKHEIKEKIKNIDTIINNKNLLEKEYAKRNEELPIEKKIFSIRILIDIMAKEREDYFEKMEEINNLLKPKNYVTMKQSLLQKMEYLSLAKSEDKDIELTKELIKLQEIFLKCFIEKINKTEGRKEIVDLMYQFRYYCLIPLNMEDNIFQAKELEKSIQEAGKLLIKKAIDSKIILQISTNKEINYDILKNMFIIRTIDLEKIDIKLTREKDKYYVQIFDSEVIEIKSLLEEDLKKHKKEMKLRLNKKIRLFE